MSTAHILLVDDDRDLREVLSRQLEEAGYRVYAVSNAMDAVDLIKGSQPDLLITDLQMPGVDGMRLVQYASDNHPEMPVLVITGYPSVQGAVEAVKSGAMEYMVKPFTGAELIDTVQGVLKRKPSRVEESQTSTGERSATFHGIIGQSEATQAMVDMISRINNTRVTVLVHGESGTGKELAARAIHYSGKFAKSPFVAVNCGGIPENLLESELFGYTKGAFTGADSTRAGFFQAADGGTIFLDEIGNASMAVQQRLLRVLQEKEVTMIGSQKAQKIDVRIIAATNSDLLQMAEKGTFREDLYYRLNVINLRIPPLRERKDDLHLLVRYFIQKFAKEFQVTAPQIDERAWNRMLEYSWPGNIRELENTIQRAIILCDGKIGVEHLPEHFKYAAPVSEDTALKSLAEVELEHIKKVLLLTDNNKSKAAEILGITRKTLRQKLGSSE